MPRRRGLLSINPGGFVQTSRCAPGTSRIGSGWRCDHEDGRGRCTSRDTTVRWNPVGRYAETWCPKHDPGPS